MIERSIYQAIKDTISTKPVTLITGARQTGKTTLCGMLRDDLGIEYVTLADREERQMAVNDPSMFLKVHPHPLIIDEVQKAPGLFEEIESVVDRERLNDPDAHSLYILAGSQAYRLMEGISQSMSGRVSIVTVSPISLSEEYSRPSRPFSIDVEYSFMPFHAEDGVDMFERMVRGMYPEIVADKGIQKDSFYSDYVDTYIMRDVTEMIHVKNRDKFQSFMEVVASLTGQELVYETITKAVGIDQKTAKA